MPNPMPDERPFWEVPWKFLVHALVGSSIFLIIGLFAYGLGYGVNWLRQGDPVIFYGMKGAEYAIFGADLFLLVVFLIRTVRRMTEEMYL
jgi:hypothetical protein